MSNFDFGTGLALFGTGFIFGALASELAKRLSAYAEKGTEVSEAPSEKPETANTVPDLRMGDREAKAQIDYRTLAKEYAPAKEAEPYDPTPSCEKEHPEDDIPVEDGEEAPVIYRVDPDKDYEEEYEQETLIFFIPDGLLYDLDGEMVEAPEKLIGPMEPTYEDYPVVYIRNEFLKTDFEVMISLEHAGDVEWPM